ncbi:hypothetical protein OGAPHI_005773 [Ogataea philodendri]|uniref:Uncharacterized protein n=1 Tax=Ogataea philodendri TaxID=1378263 RepID=A0A9P8T1G9_9ASCO|nr:uncharacterized protein OGAPHI_005773 [Ogataea philodendri]KAH3662521.1 hypothetical protein OGAPHI_005773 [Ogataea philodendri]
MAGTRRLPTWPVSNPQFEVEQTQEETAHANRHLDPEHESPAVLFGELAAQGSERRACSVAQVGKTLVDSSFAQRNQVTHGDASQSVETRSETRQEPANDKRPGCGGRGTLQASDREDSDTAQNHWSAAKNVRQLAQRLDD